MSLNHELIGVESAPVERSWTSDKAILYAIGVGAGLGDPGAELEFTTENSQGVDHQVLPTFPVVLGGGVPGRLGDFSLAMLLHAGQEVELPRPLPVAGTARVTTTVTGIYDKGSGGLMVTETRGVDPATGEPLYTTRNSLFIRGEGGFGGDRGPTDDWARPDRKPDHTIVYETRPEQGLLYRLSGDRNPLHSDPKFAAAAGFNRPILHGLCTYGFTGRALLHAVCDSDPARFRSMTARFSKPVMPGDTLTVTIWAEESEALFQTTTGDGTVVIDKGRVKLA